MQDTEVNHLIKNIHIIDDETLRQLVDAVLDEEQKRSNKRTFTFLEKVKKNIMGAK